METYVYKIFQFFCFVSIFLVSFRVFHQGGAKNFDSLHLPSHTTPDQNSETAPDLAFQDFETEPF